MATLLRRGLLALFSVALLTATLAAPPADAGPWRVKVRNIPAPPPPLGGGCDAPPTGSAQYPSLLSSYTARPSWAVSGVDCPVGPNSGITYKNPAVDILPAGTSYDTVNKLFRVSGDNVTVDGWDFSLNGGYTVYVTGQNPTITNSKFGLGANGKTGITVTSASDSGGTIKYNVFDGAFTSNGGQPGIINLQGDGSGVTWTVQYNWLKNVYEDFINVASNAGTVTLDFRYNLFENNGRGPTPATHSDWVQVFGTTIYVAIVDYNTVKMDALGSDATQGFTMGDNTFIPTFSSISLSNNVLKTSVTPTTGGVSYAFIIDRSDLNGVGVVNTNYVDMTDVVFGLTNFANGPGPYSGNPTKSGNINMVTGATIP